MENSNFLKSAMAALAATFCLAQSAYAVPIAPETNGGFYQFQLRGIRYEVGGQRVGVHVYDRTFDSSAYGRVIIGEVLSGNVLYDFTSGNYGDYATSGTFDTATFLLPYNVELQYDFSGQEFSRVDLFFGSSAAASGGTYFGNYPTARLTETISQIGQVPLPASALLLCAGLFGIGALCKSRKS